ncbi:MAG: chemotaxis protein CheX [Lachnospiraceae bacterium]|nr:chemotaxis protein CheX [Lachnospiraceae bacterium]
MIQQLFGDYLVKTGKLSDTQLQIVFDCQKKVRVKLGLIAVAEKLMTPQQSDELNRLQAVVDKRFGDLAIEKGYLTEAQVSKLLSLQGNAYLTFIQAIADNGYMTLDEIESALAEFQKENAFTTGDMEAIKADDVDKTVALFLPADADALQIDLMQTAVRAFIRLINSDIFVEKAYWKSSFPIGSYAIQHLRGARPASLLFAGQDDSLLTIAEPFAGEEFEVVDMDALDAVGEFTNCVNGMFCAKISSEVEMDMLPPSFRDGEYIAKANRMCIMPIHVGQSVVYMITTFDETIVI